MPCDRTAASSTSIAQRSRRRADRRTARRPRAAARSVFALGRFPAVFGEKRREFSIHVVFVDDQAQWRLGDRLTANRSPRLRFGPAHLPASKLGHDDRHDDRGEQREDNDGSDVHVGAPCAAIRFGVRRDVGGGAVMKRT